LLIHFLLIARLPVYTRYFFKLGILLFSLNGLAFAAEVINNTVPCSSTLSSIQVIGNKITREDYLIKWSGLTIGTPFSAEQIQIARQKLFDTGLYREVEIFAENLCLPMTSVTILVEEKHYNLVYPRLSRNGDGDIDKGLTYQGSNLFGADHTFKLTLSQKDYVNGDTADRMKFSYDWPMTAKPYDVRFLATSTETLLADTIENITETDQSFSFLVGRDWLSNPFDKPVTVLVKLTLQEKSLDQPSADLTLEPGLYNTLGIRLEYDDVHNEKYRRYGHFYALELNRGIPALGTDFETSLFSLEARYYYRLNALDNLNSRFIFAFTSSKTFNEYNFSMGGANTLRGLESDTITGNSLWQGNVEYVQGFRRWPSFRLALFTDFGNVFKKVTQFNDHDWQQTVGLGLRWKIESFVNTDLVLDYAYDPDTAYSKIYASTSLVF
jgi:outer membrane protein assembly factor BamA